MSAATENGASKFAREVPAHGPAVHQEQHYRIAELATMWGFSPRALRRLFRTEPGVIRIANGKREALSVPSSVAARVHDRISFPAERTSESVPESDLSFPRPFGVVSLSDFHRRVVKQA
jgi:hypothetical protein